MKLNEYKRNIKENKNYKVKLYIENKKTYMCLEFDSEFYDGTIIHAIIPKINLNTIDIVEEHLSHCQNFSIKFHTDLVNESFMLMNDVTPRKEMTVEEIEKELGYKIKIKNREMI
jgi:hypothetical protein